MFKLLKVLVSHFDITCCRFCLGALTKEEHARKIKGLINYLFVESFLDSIRVVISLQNHEVAEQKRVDLLLVIFYSGSLSEKSRISEEPRKARVN